LSSGEEFDTEKSRKRRKKEKKTQKKSDDKSKSEHEPDEEAQIQRAVVRQESGLLEENEIIQLMGRHVAPHLHQFQHRLNTHINKLNNQLEEQICLLYNQQNQMQEQVNYLIAQQNQHHLEQLGLGVRKLPILVRGSAIPVLVPVLVQAAPYSIIY
jgi:septal ring factor EnvC (AmiA/AmiB activator)